MRILYTILFLILFIISILILTGFLLYILPYSRNWFSNPIRPYVKHRHHNNNDLRSIINDFAAYYPDLARSYTIGRTKRNNLIKALEISDNPGIHEPGEAEVKLIGNIHGNEVVGREMLLHLIDYLLSTYHSNSTIKYLVDNLRIHIVPSINPDGYEDAIKGDCLGVQGRGNANKIDLNRNFPDRFGPTSENMEQELETLSLMHWIKKYPFVLSASLHGGALVVNYPYDNNKNNIREESKCPDDDVFRYLALLYSKNHPDMKKDGRCTDLCDTDNHDYFAKGITNGAAWYPISGGMQDWNYINSNCFELTIEVGCKKYPLSNELEEYWLKHQNSLIKFINSTYLGIRGFVFDSDGQAIENAIISVSGIDKNVTTYKTGDFWRLLSPNRQYKITASKLHYLSQTVTVDIKDSYQQNFTLTKQNVSSSLTSED